PSLSPPAFESRPAPDRRNCASSSSCRTRKCCGRNSPISPDPAACGQLPDEIAGQKLSSLDSQSQRNSNSRLPPPIGNLPASSSICPHVNSRLATSPEDSRTADKNCL